MNKTNPQLAHFFKELDEQRHNIIGGLPQQREVAQFADAMLDFLFGFSAQQAGSASENYANLMEQLREMVEPLDVVAARVIEDFSALLPVIHRTLLDDAYASLAFDPAAVDLAEVVATYPGFFAITLYRLAHHLASVGVPLLPRMLTEYAHSRTGIDIHPTAKIGHSFVIDHGTGVVIGATAEIGNHVTIYHGVTLGALKVVKAEAKTKRHPTIENHVTIYANATVLGGETAIGHNSVIGANAWVTQSVSPNSLLYFDGQATLTKSKNHQPVQTEKPANSIGTLAAIGKCYQRITATLKIQGRRLLLLDEAI